MREVFNPRNGFLLSCCAFSRNCFAYQPEKSLHHHRNHFVCAKGYHNEGDGVCRRNSAWWKHARPVQWDPSYMPSPRGDVVIGSVGGVGQTIASDPFVTLLAGVSLALRNR